MIYVAALFVMPLRADEQLETDSAQRGQEW